MFSVTFVLVSLLGVYGTDIDCPGDDNSCALARTRSRRPPSNNGWKQTALLLCSTEYPGIFKQVSIGQFGVWAVDKQNSIYEKSLTSWDPVPGKLKQISVGRNSIWGVDHKNDIYMTRNSNGMQWTRISGKQLKQISVCGNNDDVVWGVDAVGHVHRRSGNSWQEIGGRYFKHVSCGESGVWGVKNNNEVYYRTGTYGHGDRGSGSKWEKVPGRLSYISSGALGEEVWAVNKKGIVCQREGLSQHNPTGSKWNKKVAGKLRLKTVSGWRGHVWGVGEDDRIYSKF